MAACELRRKVWLAAVLLALTVPLAARAGQPEHAPPAEPASSAAAGHAQPAAGEHDAAAEEHGMLAGLVWPFANFLLLAGGLWYFLHEPVGAHFRNRHAAIRKDLEEAAALRTAAAGQLAEIERKLQALPGEIEALRRRGREEIAAEEQRIAAASAAERDRLLAEMRREIDLQVRLARKGILEHAADLAVRLAGERLQREITPADHARLVDRYLAEVRRVRAAGRH